MDKTKTEKNKTKSWQLKLASKAYESKYKKVNSGPFYAWPMGLWFSLFFIVPLFIIVCYSFMKRDVYGSVVAEFSLKAYKQMLSPAYGLIFLRTLWITIVSTIITIIVAIPCGYAIARSKHQTFLLILVIIPFLTNSLIRIFAWINILGDNGILNMFLKLCFETFNTMIGNPEAVFKPVKFMYTQSAVILVSIYMYLPYAILPIFTAVDRFDFSLLEASRDLGATKIQSMYKILLPGIKSGIISALIFTFIPIFGNYTVPNMVGGKDSYMLGNIIVDQVQKVRNWPLASAFSMVLTLISMLGILWMLYSGKKDAELKKNSTKEETSNNNNDFASVQDFGVAK
ncbi:MAG: ABC transporter permease [Treponema sp.]|nr:ABC transporter permease [Treponema sp.]MBP3608213.1 ABC transporter permease [Treponema sp.]